MKDTQEESKIIAAEFAMVFRTVFTSHSVQKTERTYYLLSTVFPGTNIATKVSRARTECVVVIKVSVVAPYTIAEIVKNINNFLFYGIPTDACNHNADKKFPLIVQCFSHEKAFLIKSLLEETL